MFNALLNFLYPVRKFELHMKVLAKLNKNYYRRGTIYSINRNSQLIVIEDEINGTYFAVNAGNLKQIQDHQ